ncbi:MFS polyamine transporter [Laetiporus sulphureus 93-53]|uniref:MFS polyamine transporter n=1 Tax=Laetiporus sulphureus 93-53 TaxID=1314785 RepID=A0A165CA59_9APHY|nr:MFS polyamine transporter [Laetiporus sulphureus 93-53]KZT02454.1 MFS polyamine transporter [Laetiporus sulphureus 93-53]
MASPTTTETAPNLSTEALRQLNAPDSDLLSQSDDTEIEPQQPETQDASKAATNPENEPDILIVDWDGPDDPANPRNWSTRTKWAAAATVSAFTFISPISSSMVAPAVFQIGASWGITSSFELSLMVSVFVLAYAVGPLFLGPLSEIFGRTIVLRGANLWYLVWNLGCGFAQNKGQLIAFRFMAGLGGSAPLATGGAVLGDLWKPEQRGQAIAIYSLAPLLGPAIGPVAGGWIAERSTWRWVFWSTSIAAAVIQGFGLIFLKETFAPLLLDRKAKLIRAKMDAEKGGVRPVKTIYQMNSKNQTFGEFVQKALVRPFVLFAQEPIIQLFGLYLAFIYGVIYLTLTTIPGIFTNVYHEDAGIGSLNYIALGIGLFATSQVNARLLDKIYIRLKKRNNGIGRPEFRLPTVFPGVILIPLGLLMSGWGAKRHSHWLVVDFGLGFLGSGMILTFQGMQTYVIDAFTLYAASALAAVSFFRSLAGFGFPLFAPAMYDALGYGVGNTILAAAALVIGPPAVWCFWRYGEKIRGMSKHAKKSALRMAQMDAMRK